MLLELKVLSIGCDVYSIPRIELKLSWHSWPPHKPLCPFLTFYYALMTIMKLTKNFLLHCSQLESPDNSISTKGRQSQTIPLQLNDISSWSQGAFFSLATQNFNMTLHSDTPHSFPAVIEFDWIMGRWFVVCFDMKLQSHKVIRKSFICSSKRQDFFLNVSIFFFSGCLGLRHIRHSPSFPS